MYLWVLARNRDGGRDRRRRDLRDLGNAATMAVAKLRGARITARRASTHQLLSPIVMMPASNQQTAAWGQSGTGAG